MTKKSIIKNIFFLTVFLVAVLVVLNLVVLNLVLAQSCPSNTEVGETQATLVGEVTNDGGDPNLEVWFQYGRTTSYGSETSHQSKYGTGLFCATVYNLEPCTTYHYRAIARNSAGTSYGENKTLTTRCAPVSVDIKANGSDGPVNLHYLDNVTLSWTSQNAATCEASGDWSGSKSTSGTQTIQLNTVKTYTFTITCRNASGNQTVNNSVQVIVSPNLPVVITKPAVITY